MQQVGKHPYEEHSLPGGSLDAASYSRLRSLAHAIAGRDWRGQTLQPTELVNEATVRLSAAGTVPWDDPVQLVALFAETIRCVLIDRYRAKRSLKRGGGGIHRAAGSRQRIPLDSISGTLTGDVPCADETLDRLALCEAIGELKAKHPDLATIVELKYFALLTIPEIAAGLNICERTVNLKWSEARVWLANALME